MISQKESAKFTSNIKMDTMLGKPWKKTLNIEKNWLHNKCKVFSLNFLQELINCQSFYFNSYPLCSLQGKANYVPKLFCFIWARNQPLFICPSACSLSKLGACIIRIDHGCGKICALPVNAKHGKQPRVQGWIFEVPLTSDVLFGGHLCWLNSCAQNNVQIWLKN
jgi:hypothetical protein